MSNIPEARRILEEARDHYAYDSGQLYGAIVQALELMKRKSPTFVAPRTIAPLSEVDKEWARLLRKQGLPMNEIARKLGTNLGRISEACA
jgi:hypothetical protein